MHCPNCGSYIAPGKRFCADCGTPAVDPEMTRLARTQGGVPARHDELSRNNESDDIEQTVFTARPTLIFINMGYIAAALSAVLLTILLALYTPISWYIVLPIAMSLLLIPAYKHIKRNMVRYTLTDSKIEIDQGLISRTTRNIPLRNIQDVTVSSSITQRLLGYGNVIIDNASEQDGETVLRNIQDPRRHADLLLRELRRWK